MSYESPLLDEDSENSSVFCCCVRRKKRSLQVNTGPQIREEETNLLDGADELGGQTATRLPTNEAQKSVKLGEGNLRHPEKAPVSRSIRGSFAENLRSSIHEVPALVTPGASRANNYRPGHKPEIEVVSTGVYNRNNTTSEDTLPTYPAPGSPESPGSSQNHDAETPPVASGANESPEGYSRLSDATDISLPDTVTNILERDKYTSLTREEQISLAKTLSAVHLNHPDYNVPVTPKPQSGEPDIAEAENETEPEPLPVYEPVFKEPPKLEKAITQTYLQNIKMSQDSKLSRSDQTKTKGNGDREEPEEGLVKQSMKPMGTIKAKFAENPEQVDVEALLRKKARAKRLVDQQKAEEAKKRLEKRKAEQAVIQAQKDKELQKQKEKADAIQKEKDAEKDKQLRQRKAAEEAMRNKAAERKAQMQREMNSRKQREQERKQKLEDERRVQEEEDERLVNDTHIFDVVKADDLDALKSMISKDPDMVRIVDDEYGATPLHYASGWGTEQMMQTVLDAGGDVHLKSRNEYMPLHTAASRGRSDAVKLLLDHGSVVNMRGKGGYTALHVAAERGHLHTAATLAECGIKISARSNDGVTAMDLAEENNHKTIVDFLHQFEDKKVREREARLSRLSSRTGRPRLSRGSRASSPNTRAKSPSRTGRASSPGPGRASSPGPGRATSPSRDMSPGYYDFEDDDLSVASDDSYSTMSSANQNDVYDYGHRASLVDAHLQLHCADEEEDNSAIQMFLSKLFEKIGIDVKYAERFAARKLQNLGLLTDDELKLLLPEDEPRNKLCTYLGKTKGATGPLSPRLQGVKTERKINVEDVMKVATKHHRADTLVEEESQRKFLLEAYRGVSFIKHGRRGRPHTRLFQLDLEEGVLQWGSGRGMKKLKLNTIISVKKGKKSKVLQRKGARDVDEKLCFTLFTNDEKSVDIQAHMKDTRDEWCKWLKIYTREPDESDSD